jgi:hypothetical protein
MEMKSHCPNQKIMYFLIFLFGFLGLAKSPHAATYYISAAGSDTNSGTSKNTPWLHAPGMYGCSNNCAAKATGTGGYTQPTGGDSFILRGGDTWDTHTNTGSGEPLDFWDFWWGGTTDTSRIYIGVDKNWYTGSSWTRPKLNGMNPLSTNAVASCTYHSGTRNRFVSPGGNYLTIDNIELLGLCWEHVSDPYPAYLATGGSHNIFQNLYFHGWTHTTFEGHGGINNGDMGTGMLGDTHADCCPGTQYLYNLCDGADSDVHSFICQWGDSYETAYSTFRNAANGMIVGYVHSVHDNLFENIYYSDGPGAHSNGFEFNNEASGDNFVYNNIIRNFQDSSAIVKVWLCPNASTYFYNNLMYGVGTSGNTFDISGNYGPCGNISGVVYAYNNTFVGVGGTLSAAPRVHYVNNHFIDSAIGGTPDQDSHNLSHTLSQAAAQGYSCTTGQETAKTCYQPTSGAGGTVNQGVSEASILTTDILGVSRPQGSAWDIGAYEYVQGGDTSPPASPTGLAVK